MIMKFLKLFIVRGKTRQINISKINNSFINRDSTVTCKKKIYIYFGRGRYSM